MSEDVSIVKTEGEKTVLPNEEPQAQGSLWERIEKPPFFVDSKLPPMGEVGHTYMPQELAQGFGVIVSMMKSQPETYIHETESLRDYTEQLTLRGQNAREIRFRVTSGGRVKNIQLAEPDAVRAGAINVYNLGFPRKSGVSKDDPNPERGIMFQEWQFREGWKKRAITMRFRPPALSFDDTATGKAFSRLIAGIDEVLAAPDTGLQYDAEKGEFNES